MADDVKPQRTDPVLLLEIVLVLLLVLLSVFLYFGPVADGAELPEWWAWIVLAVLFFALLLLDGWRRRRRNRDELHRAIREDARAAQRSEG